MNQPSIHSAPRRTVPALRTRGSARSLLLALMALMLASPSLAFAQDEEEPNDESDGGIALTVISIGGREISSTSTEYIASGSDCTSDRDIVVELDGVDEGKGTIDIYVGTNCAATDRNDTTENRCRFVDSFVKESRTQDIEVPVPIASLVGGCDEAGAEEPTLWFLAVDDSMSSEDVGQSFASIKVTIDTDPPSAPTRIRGGNGENEITVSWSVGEEVERFIVYVDSGDSGSASGGDAGTSSGGDGGTSENCGSGKLTPGSSGENVFGVKQVPVNSATATGVRLSPDDIEGDVAAVAVVAIDEAGNRSNLSATVCVRVVPTYGYRDLYEMEHGEIQQGCPCTAAGPAQAQTAWPIALAIGFVAYRGRRRRS
jgi:hypothetical protein